MRKPINRIKIIGKIYDHNLVEKITGENSKHPGTQFISGTLDIATDDAEMNIVSVHYTYVTAVTAKGMPNRTYGILKNIIETNKTILEAGTDNALIVEIDTSLALNDFYSNRTGVEELVSAKRCEGGFVKIINKITTPETDRSKFEMDMLINGTRLVEADPERNIDEDYLVVKGAVFDFRKAILPVEFICRGQGGINYFESLEASSNNLTFTKVWGNIRSLTTINRVEEESAFGEPIIKEYPRTIREWIITGTSKKDAIYEIGDEEAGITTDEIKAAMADREVYLADVKRRQDEYQASKISSNATSSVTNTAVSAVEGGFNF